MYATLVILACAGSDCQAFVGQTTSITTCQMTSQIVAADFVRKHPNYDDIRAIVCVDPKQLEVILERNRA